MGCTKKLLREIMGLGGVCPYTHAIKAARESGCTDVQITAAISEFLDWQLEKYTSEKAENYLINDTKEKIKLLAEKGLEPYLKKHADMDEQLCV